MPEIKICFVQRCDKDGNGKLDYDEFKALIFRYKTRKEVAASEEDRLGKKQIKKEPKKVGKTKIKGKGHGVALWVRGEKGKHSDDYSDSVI